MSLRTKAMWTAGLLTVLLQTGTAVAQTTPPAQLFKDGKGLFNRRIGLFVHWGIYAVDGYHEQQRWRQRMSRADYAKRVAGFTAEKFDADALVRAAESAGAEYIVFTTKHHDGFCMWDTRMTDFKVTKSPCGRDLLKELAEACRRRGMKLGLYYSNPDWNHPNGYIEALKDDHQIPPEPGDEPDLEKYVAYVKAQIRELMTNYGDICCLFWDIPPHVERPDMNALARELQPGILIDDRGWGGTGDYTTPERDYRADTQAAFAGRVEACNSVGSQSWGYRIDEDYHTGGDLTRSIDRYLSRGGNFLLNVGPKADGTLTPQATRLLAEVGRWYAKVKESYRDVETVTKAVRDPSCIVTRRGETTYFHFCKGLDATGVDLKPLREDPASVVLLNTGKPLPHRVETLPRNWQSGPSLHVWDIPADELANESVVIAAQKSRHVPLSVPR